MPDVPILPPGPSEEFLRREALAEEQRALIDAELRQQRLGIATTGSYDPSTGERQSRSGIYPVVQPPSAQMQFLNQMREDLNARTYATQESARNAAMQFQAMMAAQKMREAGANEQQIWGNLGLSLVPAKNYNMIPGMMNQTRPVQVTDVGGIKIVSGPPGTHPVPQNALPGQAFTPGEEFTTPGGTRLVRVSPNKVQVVEKSLESGRMTDQEKQQILDMRNEQKQLAKELSDFGGPPKAPWFGGQSEAQVRYTNTVAKLDEITKKRNEIYNRAQSRETGKTSTPVQATAERVVVIKDGKKFRLPASQLDEAQKQGYQLVK